MFNIGDRVQYKFPSLFNHRGNGQEGIVASRTNRPTPDNDPYYMYMVVWDDPKFISSLGMNINIPFGQMVLQPVNSIAYTQSQIGDTDDDI